MALIEFENLPSTDTAINAENLNNNFNELLTKIVGVLEGGTDEYGTWIKLSTGDIICFGVWRVNKGVTIAEVPYPNSITFTKIKTVLGVINIEAGVSFTPDIKDWYNANLDMLQVRISSAPTGVYTQGYWLVIGT